MADQSENDTNPQSNVESTVDNDLDADFLSFDTIGTNINDKEKENDDEEDDNGDDKNDNDNNNGNKKRKILPDGALQSQSDINISIYDRYSSSNDNSLAAATTGGNSIELPPWMDRPINFRYTLPLVALHNEIVGFCRLMEPRAYEISQRENLVNRFKELATNVFGTQARINVFGSQATGLFLPSSDIDIVIVLPESDNDKQQQQQQQQNLAEGTETNNNNNDSKEKSIAAIKEQELKEMEHWDAPSGSPIERLATTLRDKWKDELSYLEAIENTRVPLVKFTHKETNISIDVSFNQDTGPQAAKLMVTYLNSMPPLRPLTFVLKYFLAARALNEPYTGGVGSFMLQLMIVSFLQHRERDAYNFRRNGLCNLGALLVEFFELYSTDFNYITTGLSVRYDGFYFPKGATDRKDNFWQPQRQFMLAMENPLDPESDVGKPSYRMSTVQRSFEAAFKVLLSHVAEPLVPTDSILASILPPTDEMRQRASLPTQPPEQQQRQQPPQQHKR